MASLDQSSLEKLSQDLYLEIQEALTLKDNVALNQTSKTLALRPPPPSFCSLPSDFDRYKPYYFPIDLFLTTVISIPPPSNPHTTGWWMFPVFLSDKPFSQVPEHRNYPYCPFDLRSTNPKLDQSSVHPSWILKEGEEDATPFYRLMERHFPAYPHLICANYPFDASHLSFLIPYMVDRLKNPKFISWIKLQPKAIKAFRLAVDRGSDPLEGLDPLEALGKALLPRLYSPLSLKDTYEGDVLKCLLALGARFPGTLVLTNLSSYLKEDLRSHSVTYLRSWLLTEEIVSFRFIFATHVRDHINQQFILFSSGATTRDMLIQRLALGGRMFGEVGDEAGSFYLHTLHEYLTHRVLFWSPSDGPQLGDPSLYLTLYLGFLASFGTAKIFEKTFFPIKSLLLPGAHCPEAMKRNFCKGLLGYVSAHPETFVYSDKGRAGILAMVALGGKESDEAMAVLKVIADHKAWIEAPEKTPIEEPIETMEDDEEFVYDSSAYGSDQDSDEGNEC